MDHLSLAELEQGLDTIRNSPADHGVLELIVRRPEVDAREVLDEGRLDPAHGLVGDGWKSRWTRDHEGGLPDPEKQLTLMNSRVIALVAGDRTRWPLAGDQLFVDLDLSAANLPPGTRLSLGTAEIEITPPPHTGCKKFVSRFGVDALKFLNSPVGRQLNFRGVHARVVTPGTVRAGDRVKKAGMTPS